MKIFFCFVLGVMDFCIGDYAIYRLKDGIHLNICSFANV
jgi:hypothetical protein